MSLPMVQPSGGTPTSSDFVSLQTQWARQINALLSRVASEPSLVGEILQWATGVPAPAKFLTCSGQVILQSQYKELFSVIGTTQNTGGEPAGSFRLPAAGTPLALIIRYLP